MGNTNRTNNRSTNQLGMTKRIIIEITKAKITIKENTDITDTMNGFKGADKINVDQEGTLQQRPPKN